MPLLSIRDTDIYLHIKQSKYYIICKRMSKLPNEIMYIIQESSNRYIDKYLEYGVNHLNEEDLNDLKFNLVCLHLSTVSNI